MMEYTQEQQLGFIKNVQNMIGDEFDYEIEDNSCVIVLTESNDKLLMWLLVAFILVGCRHFEVTENKVTVHFDEKVSLKLM